MVLRLRLQRWGATHKPFYRVVAADARAKRDGKFIERVGTYDPMIDHSGRKKITFNFDRAKYWLSVVRSRQTRSRASSTTPGSCRSRRSEIAPSAR